MCPFVTGNHASGVWRLAPDRCGPLSKATMNPSHRPGKALRFAQLLILFLFPFFFVPNRCDCCGCLCLQGGRHLGGWNGGRVLVFLRDNIDLSKEQQNARASSRCSLRSSKSGAIHILMTRGLFWPASSSQGVALPVFPGRLRYIRAWGLCLAYCALLLGVYFRCYLWYFRVSVTV